MAERVVDRLEIIEAEHQDGDLLGAAAGMQQDFVHLLAQQVAVRQSGQTVMLGHEGQPRLGALALGHVHQRQQHRRLVAMDELARIDREVDQRAVGPDMLPGPGGLLVAGAVAGPRQFGVEGLQAPDRQLLEFSPAVAVMLDRGIVDGKDALAVQRADDHRHRVAVEQQPERSLALLELRDIDAQADDAAVRCQPLLDQNDAAVGQDLLMALAGLIELLDPFGDPFFLAPGRFRIIAARDANADGVLEPRARLEQIRAAAVDLGVLLVPENVAAFGVEEHDALRQDVDRLAQPLVRPACVRNGGLDLGAPAHDLADFARDAPVAVCRLWTGFDRTAGNSGDRRVLQLLLFSWPHVRHQYALLAFPRSPSSAISV